MNGSEACVNGMCKIEVVLQQLNGSGWVKMYGD